jgi:hypothetical protein
MIGLKVPRHRIKIPSTRFWGQLYLTYIFLFLYRSLSHEFDASSGEKFGQSFEALLGFEPTDRRAMTTRPITQAIPGPIFIGGNHD